MNKEILKDIRKGCKWTDKLKIHLLGKMAIKIYKKGFKRGFFFGCE